MFKGDNVSVSPADTTDLHGKLGEWLEELLWGYPELLKEFQDKVIPAIIADREQIEKDICGETTRCPDRRLQHDEDIPHTQSHEGDQDEKVVSPDLPGMSSDPPNTGYAMSGSLVSAQEGGQPEDLPSASSTETGYSESSSPPQTRPQLKPDDTEIAGEAATRSDTEKSLQMPETKIDKGKRKATEEKEEKEE